MNDRCKVSIVVPVYNAQAYIEKNLETLLHQSYDNFELIIVDDGSTDESKHIIEKHLNNDNRIKYVYQDNQGAGVARNVGLEMATGKYIIFLDADDYFEENLLEKTVEIAENNNLDICITGAFIINDKDGSKENCFNAIMYDYIPDQKVFSVNGNPDNAFLISGPFPWNKLYRRHFLVDNTIKFQNLSSINDLSFVYYSFVKAKNIGVCDECLVNYRVGGTDSLTTNNDKWPDNIIMAYTCLKSLLEKDGIYSKYEKGFLRIASWDMITALSRMRSLALFYSMFKKIKSNQSIPFELCLTMDDYCIDDEIMARIKKILYDTPEEYLFYLSVIQEEKIRDRDRWIRDRDRWIRDRDRQIDNLIVKDKLKHWYFWEDNYIDGKKYIIYGFGKVGKDFACQLANSKHSNLVAVIDKNYETIDEPYLKDIKIGDLSILSNTDFDYVIISPRKEDLAREIKSELMSVGVPKEKIICPVLDDKNE